MTEDLLALALSTLSLAAGVVGIRWYRDALLNFTLLGWALNSSTSICCGFEVCTSVQ